MTAPLNLTPLHNAIRDVPDFPKPGILFKDITPILSDPTLFKLSIDSLLERVQPLQIDKIVAIDARGFLFGSVVAYELGIGLVPIRKAGKLPFTCHSVSYSLEYGEDVCEMHVDALQSGERVVLIDDLLATGGTASAAVQLIEEFGAQLVLAQFIIELKFLNGRSKLPNVPIHSLLSF
jgi:adenine phosphoribosyltransferase